MGRRMIFSEKRDPRLVTVRRGGTLKDADHHRLAVWAADCAQHVLHFFEHARPSDDRPRRAIEVARAWARGEMTMTQARTADFAANAAAPAELRIKRVARMRPVGCWLNLYLVASNGAGLPEGGQYRRRFHYFPTSHKVLFRDVGELQDVTNELPRIIPGSSR